MTPKAVEDDLMREQPSKDEGIPCQAERCGDDKVPNVVKLETDVDSPVCERTRNGATKSGFAHSVMDKEGLGRARPGDVVDVLI